MGKKPNLRTALNRALDAYELEIASAQCRGKSVNPHTKGIGKQLLFNAFGDNPPMKAARVDWCLAAFQQKYGYGTLSTAIQRALSSGFEAIGQPARKDRETTMKRSSRLKAAGIKPI